MVEQLVKMDRRIREEAHRDLERHLANMQSALERRDEDMRLEREANLRRISQIEEEYQKNLREERERYKSDWYEEDGEAYRLQMEAITSGTNVQIVVQMALGQMKAV